MGKHHPCPCCDLGGLDDTPCPSRIAISNLENALLEIRRLVDERAEPNQAIRDVVDRALQATSKDPET